VVKIADESVPDTQKIVSRKAQAAGNSPAETSSKRAVDLVVFYVSSHTNPKRQRGIFASLPRWRFGLVLYSARLEMMPCHSKLR